MLKRVCMTAEGVFTWVQSLLSVHQRVGTDDVDEAAGASFHFVHQERQIVELVLKKTTTQKQLKAKMLINKFCCPYNGCDHVSTGTWRSRIRVPCRCSRVVASE